MKTISAVLVIKLPIRRAIKDGIKLCEPHFKKQYKHNIAVRRAAAAMLAH